MRALAPIFLGMLASASAILAQPLNESSNVPNIVVQDPDGGQAMLLLGFFAFGEQADVDRLGAAAREAGFIAQSVETEGDESEYGVLFTASTTREQAFEFIQRVEAREFGAIRVDYALVPPSAVRRQGR